MHPNKFVSAILGILLLHLPGSSQTAAKPALPDTAPGRIVAAYLQAFNTGDPKRMRDFFSVSVADSALERRPVDKRVEIYQEMYANTGGLELRKIVEVTDNSITGLFHTGKDEWRRITFEFDPQPPHKLLRLQIEDDGPPAGESAGTSPGGAARPTMSKAEVVAATERYLNELAAADKFSGVVLVVGGGVPIFQKAYGLANKEHGVPNRIDTKFNLGSINKVFTQIAIGQLIERGKMAFGDPIGKYLPDYPNRDAAAKVTIRHLLTMRSGIGDFFNEKFESTPKDRIRSIKDFLALFASGPLEFEPGTKERYSNGGYVVLGAIIEKVSGQTYYDYVREQIFKPAGMVDTDSYEVDIPTPNLATGYTREGAAGGTGNTWRRTNVYFQPARGSSAGGGYSTAPDLLKFVLAVQAEKLLSPKYTRWFLTKEEPASEQGTTSPTGPARPAAIGVAGGSPGVNAVVSSNSATGTTIIVLSNYDPRIAEDVYQKIREWFSGVRW
jgi:D-alanyl-D-alanine carboxypeptidase